MIATALLQGAQTRAHSLTRTLDGVGPLLARLTLGVTFVGTGLGKLQHLEKVTAFFTALGLPAPHFQATLVGTTELVGGALVIAGFASRLASLPLLFTMIVALLTAKRADISGVTDLLATLEWTYLVMFAWLALSGPGRFSIDGLRAARTKRQAGESLAAAAATPPGVERSASPRIHLPRGRFFSRATRPDPRPCDTRR
jgi:putative oxidoreductase